MRPIKLVFLGKANQSQWKANILDPSDIASFLLIGSRAETLWQTLWTSSCFVTSLNKNFGVGAVAEGAPEDGEEIKEDFSSGEAGGIWKTLERINPEEWKCCRECSHETEESEGQSTLPRLRKYKGK